MLYIGWSSADHDFKDRDKHLTETPRRGRKTSECIPIRRDNSNNNNNTHFYVPRSWNPGINGIAEGRRPSGVAFMQWTLFMQPNFRHSYLGPCTEKWGLGGSICKRAKMCDLKKHGDIQRAHCMMNNYAECYSGAWPVSSSLAMEWILLQLILNQTLIIIIIPISTCPGPGIQESMATYK